MGEALRNKRKLTQPKSKTHARTTGKITVSIDSKRLLHKEVLKSIWTGTQQWGTASNCNIKILQRFQSKTVRSILSVSWYANNHIGLRKLQR